MLCVGLKRESSENLEQSRCCMCIILLPAEGYVEALTTGGSVSLGRVARRQGARVRRPATLVQMLRGKLQVWVSTLGIYSPKRMSALLNQVDIGIFAVMI